MVPMCLVEHIRSIIRLLPIRRETERVGIVLVQWSLGIGGQWLLLLLLLLRLIWRMVKVLLGEGLRVGLFARVFARFWREVEWFEVFNWISIYLGIVVCENVSQRLVWMHCEEITCVWRCDYQPDPGSRKSTLYLRSDFPIVVYSSWSKCNVDDIVRLIKNLSI